MKAEADLETADHLATPGGSRRPRGSDLSVAVVVVYYALFHAVCECFANLLVGTRKGVRDEAAWEQAYRMPDHRRIRIACKKSQEMMHFQEDLRELAEILVKVQYDRIIASYSSNPRFTRSDVLKYISKARKAIRNLKNSNMYDRRAFITYLVLPERGN